MIHTGLFLHDIPRVRISSNPSKVQYSGRSLYIKNNCTKPIHTRCGTLNQHRVIKCSNFRQINLGTYYII